MTASRLLRRYTGFVAVWAVILGATTDAMSQAEGTGVRCVPVNERAGRELGCFIMASEAVGRLGQAPIYWHIDTFASRSDAEAAKVPHGTVVESLGKIWLFTIAEQGWRPKSGERVAEIGPLPINPDAEYTAQYMEADFKPGMKSTVHRHSGPEAWYTLTGETCLETPEGTTVGRAGGQYVIVPGGLPMELTATGAGLRRAEVLILHDSAMHPTSPVSDWKPKGLCR